MKPTVGRIVHYQAYGTPAGEYPSVPRAAIVTQALPTSPDAEDAETSYVVGLCILNPTGMFFNPNVPFDADGRPGTWRWPPREQSSRAVTINAGSMQQTQIGDGNRS